MAPETITPPPVRLLISETSVCGWLGQASPGDNLEYHRGLLVRDGTRHASRISEAERIELGRITNRALWAFERGFVHLVQRRHGEDDYSYVMIARPRVRKAAGVLSSLLTAEAA